MRSESVESENESLVLTIEFVLASGERFPVREFAEGESLETAVTKLGQRLATEMGTDRVSTFSYWEDDQYFFDAVSMRGVVAFSISPYDDEEDEFDEDDDIV